MIFKTYLCQSIMFLMIIYISDFENQAILEGRCSFLQLSELTFDRNRNY